MNSSYRILALLLFVLLYSTCEKAPTTPTPEVLPSLLIDGTSNLEGNEGTTEFAFTVRMNKTSTSNVSFEYSTNNGTAIAGQDYVSASGSESIPAGETQVKIYIQVLGNTLLELDKEFEVKISNAINAEIIGDSAKGTIRNDDDTNPIGDEGYSTPLTYPGYTLVWSDEFDGTALNTDDWSYETGDHGWGNNELQDYREGTSNATVVDGKLVIEAKKVGGNYTSARIITKDKQSFKYGRIDIRAKLPHGQGIWPALWMLGDNFSTAGWPSCGEIDIMELIGNESNRVYGTVHWSDSQGNHAEFGGNRTLASGIFADEFHVFTIIWTENQIRWYVDDVHYHTIDTSPSALSEFRQNFFFIFNLAVGGDWPGSPDANTLFPQVMAVDYVRVFQ